MGKNSARKISKIEFRGQLYTKMYIALQHKIYLERLSFITEVCRDYILVVMFNGNNHVCMIDTNYLFCHYNQVTLNFYKNLVYIQATSVKPIQ